MDTLSRIRKAAALGTALLSANVAGIAAPDLTGSLEYVGNPGYSRWPANPHTRQVLDLAPHRGAIFVTGGDWSPNMGPCPIFAVDPYSGAYTNEFVADINATQGIEAPIKTASKFVMSESMKKFVDFYFKITHKENPREVYTLFRDNPEKKFSDNSEGVIPESTIDFKSSISDTIKGVSGISQVSKEVTSSAEPKMSAVAMSAKIKSENSAPAAEPKAAPAPAEKKEAPASETPAPEAPAKSIIPGKEAAPAPKAAAPAEPAPAKSIIPDLPKKKPEEQPKDPE